LVKDLQCREKIGKENLKNINSFLNTNSNYKLLTV
jgi:hypothetical protein